MIINKNWHKTIAHPDRFLFSTWGSFRVGLVNLTKRLALRAPIRYVRYKGTETEYLEQFFVGLLEGDGSIQVNHWRAKSLQFRLIIKLKNLPSNYNMLILIAKTVGGEVRYTNKNKFVIWVVNDREKIKRIIKLFDKYPLLTARKICQLRFLKNCLKSLNIEEYFATKNEKYSDLQTIINNKPFNKVLQLEYFKIWLVGFIEAEGCFSIRQSGQKSFSVSQTEAYNLMCGIKYYFNIPNKIRNPILKSKKQFFLIETYKPIILLNICNFFEKGPKAINRNSIYESNYKFVSLQGYKLSQFLNFKSIK